MRNSQIAASLFNTAYFGIASAALFCIVYESWFYGFFLAPFPVLLTAGLLIFTATAVTSVVVCFKGPAAVHTPEVSWSPKLERMIRGAALLLPIPIIAYAAMSYHERTCVHLGRDFAQNIFFVNCERVLFGEKRADDRLAGLTSRCVHERKYEVAQEYALLAVKNIEKIPFTFGDDSYKKRLVQRLEELGLIYEVQGKYLEAMQSRQREHKVVHEAKWSSDELHRRCGYVLNRIAVDSVLVDAVDGCQHHK